MPPTTDNVIGSTPVRKNRWLKLLVAVLLVIAAFAIGYALKGKESQITSATGSWGTDIYYSPQSKSIVAYGPGDPESAHFFEIPSEPKQPQETDILLVHVPYQIAGIGNATTTATGKMVFLVETLAEPITYYSEGKVQETDTRIQKRTFYYDPATNLLKEVANIPVEINRPRLVEVAPDGIKMRFSDSCHACGAHRVGNKGFVWNVETGDSTYLENPVRVFEWLEDTEYRNHYRYKEYVYSDTGGECVEAVGGKICFLPVDQVEWKYGELKRKW